MFTGKIRQKPSHSVIIQTIGITELQDQLGWKGPLSLSSPTYKQTPPFPLDHGTKGHIQPFLEHIQGLLHLPG